MKNPTQKFLIIHNWIFPLLPWAAHMAENWKSIAVIGLMHPLLNLLCAFNYLMDGHKKLFEKY